MSLEFTKMQSLGNDFVVIDATRSPFSLHKNIIQELGDRHTGVGFDQMLVAERSNSADVDFKFRIFNADGGEVGQCGNGARCFARFLRDQNLTTKNAIVVETYTGDRMELRIEQAQKDAQGQPLVTVDMGEPNFVPAKIPFNVDQQALRYTLDVQGEAIEISALSIGNPHAVTLVEDVDGPVVSQMVSQLGPLIEHHERFPERVNAGFMQVVDETQIRLRVYERGVGETRACGSGACAAMVAGRQLGLLSERVAVDLPGGRLMIRWAGEGERVLMTGPAVSVFQGRYNLPHA